MLLTIIIPVYNEEKTIIKVLDRILDTKIPGYKKQIIIVDDGSVDKSVKLVKKYLKTVPQSLEIELIEKFVNEGKGAAIISAIPFIKGEMVIIQDADLEYDPKDYTKLLENYNSKKAIYGSRLKTNNPKAYLATYLGNVLLTKFTNMLYKTSLTDSYTCYKIIPSKIFRNLNLQSKSFEIEAEITAKLAKKGVKIIEIPITYFPRPYSQGKKIKPIDAIKGVYLLLKVRFN